MTATVRNPSRSRVATAKTTFKVKFGRNGDCSGNGKAVPSGRIPRVTRLLALAHRIEGMIRTGELKDWAEASRLIEVTRARMTQIANLLLLAPEIQEVILVLLRNKNSLDSVSDRPLRPILIVNDWTQQKKIAKTLPFLACALS